MKNLRFSGIASALALLVIVLGSCTKDSLSKPASPVQPASRHITSHMTIPDPNIITIDWGGVQATINSSSLRNSLVVQNDNFTSAETYADQNGNVFISNVPEGTYTVTAHAYYMSLINPTNDVMTDKTIVINDVKVFDGQITDLGTIAFQ